LKKKGEYERKTKRPMKNGQEPRRTLMTQEMKKNMEK
jgi:hypothetical protein